MTTTYDTVNWTKIGRTFFGGENKPDWYKYVAQAGGGSLNGTGGDQGIISTGLTTGTSYTIGDFNYSLSKLLNGTLVNAQDCIVFVRNAAIDGTLWFKFEFPTAIVITMYRIWPRRNYNTNTIKDWILEGSVDDINWDTLHTVTNYTDWTAPSSNSISLSENHFTGKFENNIAYKYYKLKINELTVSNNTACYIGELSFSSSIDTYNTVEQVTTIDMNKNGNILAIGSGLDINNVSHYSRVRVFSLDSSSNWTQIGSDIQGITSEGFGRSLKLHNTNNQEILLAIGSGYTNTNDIINSGAVTVYSYTNIEYKAGLGSLDGTGGEQGFIFDSTTSGNSHSYRAFDNNSHGNAIWDPNPKNTYESPVWLTFQFPTPTIINMYKLKSASWRHEWGPKTWEIQGSNDNINWTILDNQNLTNAWGNKNIIFDYYFSNNNAYSYYRIYITEEFTPINLAHSLGPRIGKVAYLYKSINTGGNWTIKGNTITSSNIITNGGFGSTSMDFDSYGTRIAIGQPHISSNVFGEIFIYDWNNTTETWNENINSIIGGAGERIGDTVLLTDNGNTLLTSGAGTAANKIRLYELTNNTFNLTTQFYGLNYTIIGKNKSIDITGDGTVIAYSSTQHNNIGYVKVHKKEGNVWSAKGQTIYGELDRNNEKSNIGDNGIKLSSDGNRLIVSCSNYNRIGKVDVYDFNSNTDKWIKVSTIHSTNKEWFPMVMGGGYGKFGYGIACNANASRLAICGSGINGDLYNNIIPPGIIEIFDESEISFTIVPHSINNKMSNTTYDIRFNDDTSTSFIHNALLTEDISVNGGVDPSGAGGDKTTNDTYIGLITTEPYAFANLDSGFEITFDYDTLTYSSEFIIATNYTNEPDYYNPGRLFFKPNNDLKNKYDMVIHLHTVSNSDIIPTRLKLVLAVVMEQVEKRV